MINPINAGLAGGIIGAFIIFLSTLTAVLGHSKAAHFFADKSVWKKYGYRVTWIGSVVGAIIGFVYGFLIWCFFAVIYNYFI